MDAQLRAWQYFQSSLKQPLDSTNVNRIDLQQLAEERLKDCETLLGAGRYSGAYYVGGYAAECGLKACIAKNIREHEFPDKNTVQRSYSHNLSQLLAVSGLERRFESAMKANTRLAVSWSLVKDWTEETRYQIKTDQEASDLFDALVDPDDGVMKWLRDNW